MHRRPGPAARQAWRFPEFLDIVIKAPSPPQLIETADPDQPGCSILSVLTDNGSWCVTRAIRRSRSRLGAESLLVQTRLSQLPDGTLWCTVQEVIMSFHDGCQLPLRPLFFRSITQGRRWRACRAIEAAGSWHPRGLPPDWLDSATHLAALTLPFVER